MQIEITAGGIYRATKEGSEEIPVGTVMTVSKEPVQWKGRYRIIGKGGDTMVVNPATDGGREKAIRDAIMGLSEDDFTAQGKPEVDAINTLMPESSATVTAKERDAVWSKMQDEAE
ncbi:hypothetical protein FF098_014795 [Parvularcula flava]|uniref:Uncharacterized protein n=1 Tax=Aquisalinus luteolus TaxID=1566827 RepID=A0A8J3EVB7_9PROT|nr:hypothetical protein [Aquisalinus luteolus]NHK29186.1 hypothetical protein [Aquisalinus luteolus]GGI00039.1 hypothetical protein GCM10011355_27390 [Aquisalinus luteolus]